MAMRRSRFRSWPARARRGCGLPASWSRKCELRWPRPRASSTSGSSRGSSAGRPWVRMKTADLARRPHRARERRQPMDHRPRRARPTDTPGASAPAPLLTGVGTVLDDDPRLDVRLVETARQPMRVIVDSRLQTPPRVAHPRAPPGSVLVYAAAPRQRAGAAPCSRPAGSRSPRCAGPGRQGRSGGACWPTWQRPRRQRTPRGGRAQAQRFVRARRSGRRIPGLPGADPAWGIGRANWRPSGRSKPHGRQRRRLQFDRRDAASATDLRLLLPALP